MTVNSVKIKNFRNIADLSFTADNGVNVIYGENAQGKTNLLEAVFLCAIGKSPRTNKEKDLLKWNENLGKVTIEFSKLSGKIRIPPHCPSKRS